jgi:endonuclease/exonuclease/phosphatase family metal-dependent hydrolase
MKKVARIASVIITILVAALYLVTSYAVYFSPLRFPFVTIASLLYLPVLVAYMVLMVAWFFVNKRAGIWMLVLFFTGYQSLMNTVGARFFSAGWKWEKPGNSLRVMSWNVNYFGNPYKQYDSANSLRRQMLQYISKVKPDVLCVQDLRVNESVGTLVDFVNNSNDIFSAGDFQGFFYPFHFDYDGVNYCDKMGVAIFFRGAIIDTGSIVTMGPNKKERAGYADIVLKGKIVRIFSVHLSSMSLWPSAKDEAGLNYLEGDETRKKARRIYSKLTMFGEHHAREADVIKHFVEQSPYPVILAADMNAVPSSYVYTRLKNGLKDAFLENDYGIGGSYNRIFPKLRIDVLLHSPELEAKQFIRPVTDLSDHYPVIADFTWKE